MNRTLKVLIGAAFISLASLTTASAQTGSLQGARLFLFDGGIGPSMNRIGLFTPLDTGLTLNYNLTLPPNTGTAGDFLFTPDGTGTLNFTNGNGIFWRLDGNSGTTPWNGTTGSFVGTDDPTDLVIRAGGPNEIQFWNGASSSMVMNINWVGNVGIGQPGTVFHKLTVTDLSGAFNGGFFRSSRPNGYGLSVAQVAPGGTGITVDAGDVGIGIGQNTTPINGLEIDAAGVGILINKWGNAPAVGISMDGSTTGVLIQNSTYGVAVDWSATGLYVRNSGTSIDAEGTVEINTGYGAPVNINTNGSTGTVTIGNASAGVVSLRSGSDLMIQVDGGGSGDDLVLTGIDGGPTTIKILTMDAANNVRYRTVSNGTFIITGSGTLNTIPKWTPDGMTIGNSSLTDNGSLVTIANALSQTGAGQVTFSGNVDANAGLDVTGATNLTGTTTQNGAFGVTGATTINTSGASLTTLGTVGNTVRIAANDVEMTNLPAGATTDDFVTMSGSDVRRISSPTFINATAWKLGGNTNPVPNIFGTLTAHDVVMQTNGTTRLTLTSAGAITQSGTGQVTFTGNVDANLGLDVTGATNLTGTTTQTGALGVTGATTVNTSGNATTTIGNTGAGGAVAIRANADVTIDPSATGDVVLNNIDLGAATTKILTLDATDNVRYRTVSGGASIITGSGTANTIPKWTPDGFTLGNSSITDNGSLVTVTTPFTQSGSGQVTFSGNVDANSGLDVTGTTTLAGSTTATGTTDINISGAALTRMGAVGNTVRIAANDVEMTNLPAGATTDDLVTISGSDVRRVASSTFINANAWKLGGNTTPASNIFGTLDNFSVVMQTNGITRLTLTAAGAITQSGSGQVTFSGNVDANSGLDVIGTTTLNGSTTQTGPFSVTGTTSVAGTTNITGVTTVNTAGASTTAIGNTTAGGLVTLGSASAIKLNPGTAGDIQLLNVDANAATTKILTLDGSDNLRYRTIGTGSNIITGSGGTNQVARWTPDGATLGSSVITDDGSNVGISTTGTVTIASTTVNDVTINVGGGASNDLVLTGIDTDNSTTKVLTIDAGNNVRIRDIVGGGSNIVTGSGTLHAIPKWTPDGYTLGDSKLSDNGAIVSVDGSAAFNANGNVNLGDAHSDAVTIKGNLKVLPIANQFAGSHTITGATGVTTFVIPNTLVSAGSIILVTLEDGTDVANYTAIVSAKNAGVSFTVRLSAAMGVGATKLVNYQIINQ